MYSFDVYMSLSNTPAIAFKFTMHGGGLLIPFQSTIDHLLPIFLTIASRLIFSTLPPSLPPHPPLPHTIGIIPHTSESVITYHICFSLPISSCFCKSVCVTSKCEMRMHKCFLQLLITVCAFSYARNFPLYITVYAIARGRFRQVLMAANYVKWLVAFVLQRFWRLRLWIYILLLSRWDLQ